MTTTASSRTTAARSTARGHATRGRLLDTAERLFAERGVFGVSLREIRIEAGARNTNAVQFHFGDRDGLFEALLERHMPRIAAIQRDLLDAARAGGRSNDARSLVEVLVRPTADYVTLGASERAWIKIMSELSGEPDLEVVDIRSVAPDSAIVASRKLYAQLTRLVPDIIAAERMFVLAQSTVHICADRARLHDNASISRTYVTDDVFLANLIDMSYGALFAPVSEKLAARTALRPPPR